MGWDQSIDHAKRRSAQSIVSTQHHQQHTTSHTCPIPLLPRRHDHLKPPSHPFIPLHRMTQPPAMHRLLSSLHSHVSDPDNVYTAVVVVVAVVVHTLAAVVVPVLPCWWCWGNACMHDPMCVVISVRMHHVDVMVSYVAIHVCIYSCRRVDTIHSDTRSRNSSCVVVCGMA